MNRSLLGGAVAAVAVLGVAATAQAQQDVMVGHPIGVSLRAGALFPIDSTARNEGDTWFAFGAEYKLLDLSMGTMSAGMTKPTLSISVDYFGRGGISNTPVLLNLGARTGPLFYSIGAGGGAARLPDEDKILFTYQVGIGYEFPTSTATPFFVEAKFWGCQRNELNGVGVYAGVRL